MYAIVDIETTGGHASSNGITEIAILVHNGTEITEQFSTLVNPGKSIPPYIQSFTGITDEMVADAPSFDNVAAKIHSLLENNIFVAHNVNFDYSFINYQLQQAGYALTAKKLCTIRLSRKLFPGLPSYSLGNLCASLQIPLTDRHRAHGDAAATAILFERMLKADEGKVIDTFLKKNSKEQLLPPNLPRQQYQALTSRPGVYYFHDNSGKVIYVGKAKNLQKRVTSHFTGNTARKQRQDFMRNIYSISFTECATELMALVLESIEIRSHWPEFNRAQKRIEFSYGIYDYEDQRGYIRLCIDRTRKHVRPLTTFRTLSEALNKLHDLVDTFGLCPKMCMLNASKEPCRAREAGTCQGACEKEEAAGSYNMRVNAAVEALMKQDSFAVVDKGLSNDEISCIFVDNGKFYGMGYIPSNITLDHPDTIRTYIKPQRENFFIRELVKNSPLLKGTKMLRFGDGALSEPYPHSA